MTDRNDIIWIGPSMELSYTVHMDVAHSMYFCQKKAVNLTHYPTHIYVYNATLTELWKSFKINITIKFEIIYKVTDYLWKIHMYATNNMISS